MAVLRYWWPQPLLQLVRPPFAATVFLLPVATVVVAQVPAQASYELELPAGRASSTLRALAYQTDHALLFRAAEVDSVKTPGIRGRFTLHEVLEELFEGTDLVGDVTEKGVIIISNKDETANMKAASRKRGILAVATIATVASAVGENLALEEVLVSAQRRSQSLQDVPISVSVLSGDALGRANLLNLQDLATRVPTVKLVEGSGIDLINIRGVGSGRNAGFEQAVSTFVDGLYRGRSRSMRSALFDIERVEVLKGPQITYFGNNATAGAFNITTRKPSKEFEANATLLYEPDHGEYVAEGGVSGPLTESLSARLALRASGMDGYIDNYWTGEDGPDQREQFGRLSVAWEPSDGFRSDIRIDGNKARNRGLFNQELIDCPPAPEYQSASPSSVCNRYLAASNGPIDDKLNYKSGASASYADLDMVELAWTNRWEVGSHTLVATTGYYDHETVVGGGLMPVPIPGVAGAETLFSLHTKEQYDQFSQEIRIESPEGNFIEYMFGAYYARDDLAASSYSGFYFLPFGAFTGGVLGPDDPVAGVLFLDQESDTRSLFTSFTFNVREDVRLNLGLRYSVVRKSAHRDTNHGVAYGYANPRTLIPGTEAEKAAIRQALGSAPTPSPDFDRPSRSDEDLMPSVGIQYDFNDNLMGYATYTEGFKSGGYSITSEPDVFGPEEVEAIEVGLKGTLFDRRLNFGLAVFHNEYSGLQESVVVFEPNGSVLSRIRNVGEALSRGVEVNAQWAMNEYTVVLADIGYLDAKYEDFPNGPCTVAQEQLTSACAQDLSGKRKAWAPLWSGSVGFRITYPVGGLELSFEPNLSFSSSMYHEANADPLMKHPGYAKLDARLGLGSHDGRWEVALVGRNLTDRTVASRITTLGTAPGSVTKIAERPRSVAVQLNLRY